MKLHYSSRGDIAVMTAFIVATVMLMSALTIGLVVGRQLRLTLNIVSSDRAFYAANSGVEAMLYTLSRTSDRNTTATGTIDYPHVSGTINSATYSGEGSVVVIGGNDVLCVKSQGQFGNERRFVQVGPSSC